MRSFSHTNHKVKDILISNLPEYELKVMDIWECLINIKNALVILCKRLFYSSFT